MAGNNTVELNDKNFDAEVLKATAPVLVDFGAEWCGPCQMLAPTIDELASEYAGRAKVGKVDIDASQAVAARYGVQNIPTVIVFVKGEPAERFVGLRNKRDYKAAIDNKLAPAS